MDLVVWKVILKGRPDPINGEPGSTRWWVWVAASSREIAVDAASAYVGRVATAMGEPLPIGLGQVRVTSDEVQPGRSEGEICRVELYMARRG